MNVIDILVIGATLYWQVVLSPPFTQIIPFTIREFGPEGASFVLPVAFLVILVWPGFGVAGWVWHVSRQVPVLADCGVSMAAMILVAAGVGLHYSTKHLFGVGKQVDTMLGIRVYHKMELLYTAFAVAGFILGVSRIGKKLRG